MANRNNRFSRPRRNPRRFGWRQVSMVALLILLICIFFDLRKRGERHEPVAPPSPIVRQAPLPAKGTDYGLQQYTSVHSVTRKGSGAVSVGSGHGTLAVIVDDMGSSLREARELLAIGVPLTFSIIPGLPQVTAVVGAAAAAGTEVMVHLPMEPQGYPQQRLEANGLLVGQSAAEITARTEALLAAVPGAAGANNHMGSRFTEQEEKMLPVLQVLKDKGLFFIDSRTTPRSTGMALATRLGIKSAARNVFLDNQQDVTVIRGQLRAAAAMATRVRGGVVAICHPHPATIQALREEMPQLQHSGVRFVAAGELVR